MANEATVIIFPQKITDKTISSAGAVEKGALLTLTDPRTVATVSSTVTTAGYVFGGIAMEEKVAGDPKTQIGVAHDGVWDIRMCGAGNIGVPVKSVGGNYVAPCLINDLLSGTGVGKLTETAADNEVVAIEVGVLF